MGSVAALVEFELVVAFVWRDWERTR